MKASARFEDPGSAMVVITLRGMLQEFETLRGHLNADKPVPHYAVSQLLDQIHDASRRLRATVHADTGEDEQP